MTRSFTILLETALRIPDAGREEKVRDDRDGGRAGIMQVCRRPDG